MSERRGSAIIIQLPDIPRLRGEESQIEQTFYTGGKKTWGSDVCRMNRRSSHLPRKIIKIEYWLWSLGNEEYIIGETVHPKPVLKTS